MKGKQLRPYTHVLNKYNFKSDNTLFGKRIFIPPTVYVMNEKIKYFNCNVSIINS